MELEPEDALERLAKLGWHHLELAEKHWLDVNKRGNPEADFKNLKRLCENLGVSISQMHGHGIPEEWIDPQKAKEHMELAKRGLRWAGILGIKWVVTHPGIMPMDDDPEALEEVRRKNISVFRELLNVARESVGIAVENLFDGLCGIKRTFGSTPVELTWLIENVGQSQIGICWDTGHANVQRLDQYRAIKTLAPHLVATHIADNDTTSDQHLLPFEGTVDWKGVMAALQEIGYKGPFNLEVGRAVHKVPLGMREEKLRYILKLTKAMIEGNLYR